MRDRLGHVVRWFGTNTDVDQVKRVQQALRDESNVLELLNSTGTALASQRDLRSLLQTVTDAATGISGARFGAFFYHGKDSGDNTFTLYTLSGAAPAEFEALGLSSSQAGEAGAWSEPAADAASDPATDALNASADAADAADAAARSGHVVVRSDDITQDARYGLAQPHFNRSRGVPQVRSYLAVPVVARSGEVLGSLFFGHPEAGIFTERTERIVGGIAAQAAVAIDNTRLYEAAQRAAEERKVLLESERSARAEAERTKPDER